MRVFVYTYSDRESFWANYNDLTGSLPSTRLLELISSLALWTSDVFVFLVFLHSSQHQKTPSKHPKTPGPLLLRSRTGKDLNVIALFSSPITYGINFQLRCSHQEGLCGAGLIHKAAKSRGITGPLRYFKEIQIRLVKYDCWIVFFSMAFRRFTSKKDAHQKYQKRHNSGNIDLWLHQNVSLVSVLLSLLILLMIRFFGTTRTSP